MAKWTLGTETGILRKTLVKDKHEDLFVFGYACKLFREDEKALYIDQGKHLIPWMGNDSLKIDRYDCRGALSELIQYEANREDYDVTRWLGLSESERKIEVLCDEERYYSLTHNEEELEMYKEEELKRLHQKGSEIQYNYDVPVNPEVIEEVLLMTVPEDETFHPPPELEIPADMIVPKTIKENSRIEKTALFISKQGPQMEILIKTKQAENSQFSFMNKDDPLYNYYKHILTAIKSGQYKVDHQDTDDDQKEESLQEQDVQEDHYLHPSLLATAIQSAPTPVPTVTYKPSPDCSYSQLVNRIQGTHTESQPFSSVHTQQTVPPDMTQTQMTYEQQQQQYYQQYYYAAQYYEYYKQMAQQMQGQPQDKMNSESGMFAQNYTPDQNTLNYFQTQAYSQYLQQSSINPYAQIVTNLSHTKEPVPDNTPSDITKAPIIYNQNETAPVETPILQEIEPEPEPIPEVEVKKPLLSLAEYGSDSETEEVDESKSGIVVPPEETQQIIDKMASYVAKNGKDFENIVKAKEDPRFEFLTEHHEYNSYYQSKIKEYSENDDDKCENKEHVNGIGDKLKEKKILTPVSFSIKKSKDEVPKEIKSALPVEESDEDPETGNATSTSPPNTIITTTIPVNSYKSLTPPPKIFISPPISTETAKEKDPAEPAKPKGAESADLVLEMIDLTEDLEEKRESRRAEDRKKDKIAAAAREKVALQLERKKKAAAFLKLKSESGTNSEPNRSRKRKSNPDVNKNASSKKVKNAKAKEATEAEVLKIEDSESEEGEIKKQNKSSKKKKSHKRKRSRSRHESKSRHKSKEHKKSKKKRKRSESDSSDSSS